MNNLFILDLDKLLAEARSNPHEKRTAEQIVYTWLLKHIAKSLINRDVFIKELPKGTHTEKAFWVMKWLHLSDYEIEGMVATLFRNIEEGIHGAELCDEFRTHWTHNTGISANVSYATQEEDIVEAVNKYVDHSTQDYSNLGGMTSFFEDMFKRFNPNAQQSTIESWTEISLEEALKKEIEYIENFDFSFGAKRYAKVMKHLNAGNVEKYTKLMNKYGLKIQHFLKVGDNYVPVGEIKKSPMTGMDLDGDVTAKVRRPTFANGKSDEWTELLLYKPSSKDPIEQHWECDKHYLEHGVNLEMPLSFTKGMSFYTMQLQTGEITMSELLEKVNRLLERVLGKELYSQVELRESEHGIMLGFKEINFSSFALRTIITEKLLHTTILN